MKKSTVSFVMQQLPKQDQFCLTAVRLIESNVSRPARFVMAFCQLDLLVEGVASVRNGRKSIHFARSKFLEGPYGACRGAP